MYKNSWHKTEKLINKEKEWLKKVVKLSPYKDKNPLIKCNECIFRRIAILIVSGKVNAKEINFKNFSLSRTIK